MQTSVKKRVVTIGGGTGSYTILRGLKKFSKKIDISAVVTMADNGGSTGRLRDEFGQLPIGDVRMAIAALAPEIDNNNLLRELFLYRFNKGKGLSGHNFGNLFLTALTDILGDSNAAIEKASRILRISGKVLPVTLDDAHLKAVYDDGQVVVGEHLIDDPDSSFINKRIFDLSLTPKAILNPAVRDALINADLIIFGPGDFYTSILANCVVDGFREALALSKAKSVFISNLMSRLGQTVGMNLSDYLHEFKKYTGLMPDFVLCNSTDYPHELLHKYLMEGNHPVLNDVADSQCTIYNSDLVSNEGVKNISGDVVKRSLIRHDSDKLTEIILRLV